MRSLLLCVVLPCAACMIQVGPTPTRDSPVAAPSAEEAIVQLARAVLAEANRVRDPARALLPDPALDRAAMKYAAELALRGYLSHQSETPGHETLTRRIEAEGGTWRRAGENLANMSGPGVDVARTTIRLWLDSPGHRANLLDVGFTHTGVGVAPDRRGGWYVVQIYTIPGRER